jgi:16S rRNA C967 or C1407 C5-methylase (RsmB/RsmF family)/NOL1/NOP2/fmu family ribosome biogenesis protein
MFLTDKLPAELLQSLSKMDHFDPAAFISVHKSGEQVVSVHLNPVKLAIPGDRWPSNMIESSFEISARIPWAPDAYYLSTRPSFTLDPMFHAGAYYVQEASGMFLAFAFKQITEQQQKLRVLDLCAAPGGKSTLVQSLISQDSVLISNEVIKKRVPALYQNMTKWGRANGIVSSNDPAHFKRLSGFFNVMVVDAPCSGSGLFRKDPETVKTWSPDLVRLCSQRQQRILADAWDCLSEDGFLIYCTCSYSKEENEDILDMIFRDFSCISVALSPDPEWNIVETFSDYAGAHGYRFYPDKLLGEGFFLSVVQKKQTAAFKNPNKKNRSSGRISRMVEEQVSQRVNMESVHCVMIGESVHAIPDGLAHDFEFLQNNLYLKKAGIRVGKPGQYELVPDHELALANILRNDISFIDLSKRDALHFLRGEPFETHAAGKGWRITRFQGQCLGWVKLLGDRMNNYYPKSWRIRQ